MDLRVRRGAGSQSADTVSPALSEREVAGADVGVQRVLTRAVFLKRAEQTSMGFVERCRFKVAARDGGIDAAVVSGIADGDVQVAGVELNVFIAGNAFDRKISGRHAHKKHGGAGNFYGDLQIVLWPTKDAQVGLVISVGALEAHGELAGVVGIPPGKMDGDLVVIAAPDPEFARAQVQAKLAPGGEVHHERVILKVADSEFRVRQAHSRQ